MSSSGDSVDCQLKKPFNRLPTSVVPVLYDINIRPNLVSSSFDGFEKVNVLVRETVNRIVLNVEGLTFDNAVYVSDSNCKFV